MNSKRRIGLTLAALIVTTLFGYACSGPQPLGTAIRSADEQAYLGMIADGPITAEMFYRAKAAENGTTVDAVRAADESLSTDKNPFNARKDPTAVSRGAVIYKYNCAGCHGMQADGRGPDMPIEISELNFHRFATRFAVTIHGGAPSKWFRQINEGAVSDHLGPDGQPLKMEPFKDRLSREQIWLVVTYLQSLG